MEVEVEVEVKVEVEEEKEKKRREKKRKKGKKPSVPKPGNPEKYNRYPSRVIQLRGSRRPRHFDGRMGDGWVMGPKKVLRFCSKFFQMKFR